MIFEATDPRQRRQRSRQLPLSDGRRLPRRRVRHRAVPGARHPGDTLTFRAAAARPDADVRQPAGGAAGRRLHPRPGARRRPRPTRRSRSATTASPRAGPGAACSRSRASASGSSTRSGNTRRAPRSGSAPTTSRATSRSAWRAASSATRARAGASPWCSRARTASAPTRRAAFQRDAGGIPARRVPGGDRRPALHVRRSTGCRRRWTSSRRPASARPTSSTTRCTPR